MWKYDAIHGEWQNVAAVRCSLTRFNFLNRKRRMFKHVIWLWTLYKNFLSASRDKYITKMSLTISIVPLSLDAISSGFFLSRIKWMWLSFEWCTTWNLFKCNNNSITVFSIDHCIIIIIIIIDDDLHFQYCSILRIQVFLFYFKTELIALQREYVRCADLKNTQSIAIQIASLDIR